MYIFYYSIEQYYKITAIVFRLYLNTFSPVHSNNVLCTYDNAYVHVIRDTNNHYSYRYLGHSFSHFWSVDAVLSSGFVVSELFNVIMSAFIYFPLFILFGSS